MFIHNRLTQHVSAIIMPIVRRTDCIKPRLVLAWMCWLRFCGVGTRAERTAVHSARVPTPHNRSQHIQANTRRVFIQSVLLTMGIMMAETCWVNLLWININTCVICWFFLLLNACLFAVVVSVSVLSVHWVFVVFLAGRGEGGLLGKSSAFMLLGGTQELETWTDWLSRSKMLWENMLEFGSRGREWVVYWQTPDGSCRCEAVAS